MPRRSGSKTRDTGAAKSGYLKKITRGIFSTVRKIKIAKTGQYKAKEDTFPYFLARDQKLPPKKEK